VVYTSGVWVLGETGDAPVDEHSTPDAPAAAVSWRPAHEQTVLGAGRSVVPAVVRPGVIYGGRRGLMGRFFATAEEDGAAVYYGEGRGRMALVYLGDAARVYRLVVEKGAVGVFHAVDGTPIAMAEVAKLASEAAGAGGAVRSAPVEELRAELGPAADALMLDQVVSARRSEEELGWVPEQASYRDGVAVAYREWQGAVEGAGS
jgi:nucleoside-diphosphate-sugar epimerase